MRKNIRTLLLSTIIILTLGSCASKPKTSIKAKEYTSAELKTDGIFLDASTQKNLGNLDKAVELYDQVISINPNYASAYFDKANVMFQKKEVQKAIELTQKAISLQPQNIWYHLQLAEIYINIQDYDNAALTIENIIEIEPDNIDYYQQLAQIYNQKQDQANMLRTFDRIEQKWGQSEEITMFKFRYFMDKKDYDRAEKEINKLQTASPSQKSYLAILAEINMNKQNYPKALEYYQKIEQIDPQDPYVNVSFANYYLVQNDRQKVYHYITKAVENKDLDYQTKIQVLIAIYGKTVDSNQEEFKRFFTLLETLSIQYPEEKVVWELLSTCYMQKKEFEQAVKSIKKAIEIGNNPKSKQPNNFELYQNLLFAESTLNQIDTLIADATKTIELFPEQPLPYLFLGINYLLKEEYENAKKNLENGLMLVVENKALLEDFYSNLAEASYRLNQTEKAFEYFDKALEINPNNYIALNNYAYYLSLQQKDLDKAEKMAKTVFDQHPNNQTYADTYAWVLYVKKDYQGAYRAMQSIISQKELWSPVIKEHYELILKALNR